MFSSNIGWGELLIFFLVVLVLFGPRRLPEISRQLGRFLGILRKTLEDFKREIDNIEIEETITSTEKNRDTENDKRSDDENSSQNFAG